MHLPTPQPDPMRKLTAEDYFWRFVGLLGAIAALLLIVRGCEAATVRNELALAKCRLVVTTLYPDSGFYPWCGTLIAEHERYGDADFAASWWWSLVYGGANFSLRVGATSEGLCSGPMDVKSTSLAMHRRMTRDTAANIRHHVAEMHEGWGRGYRDLGLCEYVFLPAAPRDWGRGRFRRTDARHRAVIDRAYREGRLP